VLAPEQITEYPNLMELSKELQQLGDWSRWQAADAGVDSSCTPYPEAFYASELSIAPRLEGRWLAPVGPHRSRRPVLRRLWRRDGPRFFGRHLK
jgi:hypothetical protein